MSMLVNQLLDLARKESVSGRGDLAARPIVNLSRLVREAAAGIVPLIERADRRLEIDVPDTIAVRGQADDLRDLVRNLLENAVWHGSGTVSVCVRRTAEGQAPAVTIEVADEGPGVPAGKEERRSTVSGRFAAIRRVPAWGSPSSVKWRATMAAIRASSAGWASSS